MLVVFELDITPLNSLVDVLFLFQCEHVLVELLLKFFVSVIDAKLFEWIFSEDFEAKDV